METERQDQDATWPELAVWPATSARYRRSEVSAVIGTGEADWQRATDEVLRVAQLVARRRYLRALRAPATD